MLAERDLARLGALLRSDRFSRAELKDKSGVMVDAEGMRMLSLNETGLFVVGELVSGRGFEALVERLVQEFRVSDPVARQDLEKFIGELNRFVSGDVP